MKKLKITKQITNRDSEALERYLADIARTELLSPEQEAELAARAKRGDKKALEDLIKANLRFVVSVAKQYQNRGLSLEDLINEGNIGLIKAAKTFDETRGFKFISYAVWWIRQAIMQALAEKSKEIRLPVNKVGILNKIRQTYTQLQQELKRDPTPEEIAKKLNIDLELVKETLRHHETVIPLESPMGGEDSDLKLIDIISNNDYRADKKLLEQENKEIIEKLLKTLPERDARILKMYYGIGYSHRYTLDEIGAELNLTRERVRQIKNKAMKQLQKYARKLLEQ